MDTSFPLHSAPAAHPAQKNAGAAALITPSPITAPAIPPLPIPLDAASPGEAARIVWLRAEGMLGQRLADMGFCPGARVEVVRSAPLGDPLQVELDGVMVCIRRAEAAQVEVLLLDAVLDAVRAEMTKVGRP